MCQPYAPGVQRAEVFGQTAYSARFEWGEAGIHALASAVDVLVLVDVLSFTTAVEVAVARGASVYPYHVRDATAAEFAAQVGAVLAVDRRQTSAERPFSLSPPSLTSLPVGSRLVLPSPNGSTLTMLAADLHHVVLAGCLRNARAVATAIQGLGRMVGVIAAGERWPDGTLRFAVEDLVGAGATVRAYDPAADAQARRLFAQSRSVTIVAQAMEALEGADALAIVTEWQEFRSPDFAALKQALKTPAIFDGRNLYDPAALRAQGLEYYPIGRRQ
jgi:phosphosulfolactate phosphohydrolase-like enzyme